MSAPVVQTDFVNDLTRVSGNTTIVDSDKQLFLEDGFFWLQNFSEEIIDGFHTDNGHRIVSDEDNISEPTGIQRAIILAAAMLAMLRRLQFAVSNHEFMRWTVRDADKSVSQDRGQEIRMNIVKDAEKVLKEYLRGFSTRALIRESTGPIAFQTLDPEFFLNESFFDAFRLFTANRKPENVV